MNSKHRKRKSLLKIQEVMTKTRVFSTICLLFTFSLMYLFLDLSIVCYDNFKAIDNELYYYGYNRLNKYDLIARQVRPIGRINARLYGTDYCFNGFTLLIGEFGQNFINKGGEINGIMVDSICSYGFNDHMVVTEIISNQGIRYYDIADFDNFNNSTEVRVDTSCITNPITHFKLDNWIFDANHPTKSLCKMSDFCIRLFLFFVILEIVLLVITILLSTKIIKSFF